jgi:ABC-type nitrate/sulfonate/bicarbonate transport system substrate-binding protein
LVSNSYFPAIAAIELGFFAREGLDVAHELIFPNYKAYEALRDGKIDFVAGPAHAVFRAFPEWEGAKLLAALAQGMYWLLVMRTDLAATPGDVNAVKGRTIGAAPLVDQGLKRLLIDAGLDLDRHGVRIVGVPGASEPGVSFGVAAAKALEDGKLDGFWANAMGAENAVRGGVGKVILDVRRGLGPPAAFHYTMPVLATSDHTIKRDPNMVAAGMRAVVQAQRALKRDVGLATQVGKALFPPAEAALIAGRDRARFALLRPDSPQWRLPASIALLRQAAWRRDQSLTIRSLPWSSVTSGLPSRRMVARPMERGRRRFVLNPCSAR